MAGKNDIVWSSDDKDLVKSQAKLIQQNEKMIAGYQKLLREAKKAAKEGGTELERFAKKTNRINRTPLQRYKEEMQQLNAALKAGLINQTVYNSAVQRAGQTYKASFGGDAIASLSLVATGVMVIKRAWDSVVQSIQSAIDAQKQFGDKQSEAAKGLGELTQLADTPEDLKRMIAAAKQTFREGGAATLDEAAALQFSLESAGIAKYRKDVSALQATGIVGDSSGLVTASAALLAALGEDETGSFRDIVSKGFGASKVSPARMEEILQASARSGAQAKALGLSDEEIIAGTAAISKVTGSADLAGTQVESLLKQIEKFGIGEGYLESGKSLREQVGTIKQLVDEGTNIRDILGDRQEGIKAFRTLAGDEGRGLYDQAMKNINQAVKTDAFGTKIRMARTTDPIMAAAQIENRNKAIEELSGQSTGIKENLADALEADLVADLRDRGRGEFAIDQARHIFKRQRGHKWYTFPFNDNETFIERFGGMGTNATQQNAEAIGIMLEQSADSLRGAAANLEQSTAGSQTNAARANAAAAGGGVETR